MITSRFLKLLGIIALVIALFGAVIVWGLPSTAYMERSLLMSAPPEVIYKELISFRNFEERSPWAKKNVETTYTIGTPESGVGANISWESESEDMRSGKIEIIDVLENQYVISKMQFEGYGSNPRSKWLIEPTDSGTMVTWAFEETQIEGFNKVFMLGIDGFLGSVYEEGLQLLKQRVESAPQSPYQICVVNVMSRSYLGIDDFSMLERELVSSRMKENFELLEQYVRKHKIEKSKPYFTIYKQREESEITFSNCIPIIPRNIISHESIYLGESYSGQAVKATYQGDYEFMLDIHKDIEDYISFYNYKLNGNIWEEYELNRISRADSVHWKMSIFYPIK